VEEARAFLRAFGAPVLADVCDLRNAEQARTFIQRVEQELGPVQVVVANAATIEVAPIETLTPDDFQAAMREIFGSAVNVTLAALPHLQARQRGTVALITSIGGRLGVPHLAPYTAAKFAEVGFGEALQAEVAKDGIRVLTVAPGLMRTGSHWHATFKGRPAEELAWFGTSAVSPLISIDADRAARRVVSAIAHGDRYLVLTPAAMLGAWMHDRAPELWSALFSVVGRLLPRAPEGRSRGDALEGRAIFASSGSWLMNRLRERTARLVERHGQ
jgi:NAD(P)-dependent dehydrogenase (short-subunit alcohol dehydrogenase family)